MDTTRARATIGLLLLAGSMACAPGTESLSTDQALDAISLDLFVEHMNTLSSDAMAGRRPGTAGYDSAAAYVAREAEALGLEPGGVNGTFFQPITFRSASVEPGSPAFSVGGEELEFGSDFSLSPRTMTTETDVTAPLVFAGYGISAPDLGYDDYAAIDVRGKLAVVISGAPDGFGSLERTVLSSSASRDAELRERGAVGVVVVEMDGPARASLRPRLRFLPAPDGPARSGGEELVTSLTVTRDVVDGWMSRTGRDLDDVWASIRSGEPASFEMDVEGRVRASYVHETFESANVAARLPGADPDVSDEHLVMTAHLDHLGVGTPLDGDSIFNGTLDNASGSAALLTLADVLTRMAAPRRSVLFLWLTAEESGLLGSEYFARFPTIDRPNVVANQNIDGVMGMIASATDVLAFGYEHSNLSDAVDFAVGRTGTPVSPDPTPDQNLFVRSDQYAFVREGVPAIWVQAGRTTDDPAIDAQAELDRWIDERYHDPADDPEQPVDMVGVRLELENNLLVTWHIVNEMGPIQWDEESFLFRRWVDPTP